MPNAPLQHITGTTVTTVVDPRFGTGAAPLRPADWASAEGVSVPVLDVAASYGTTTAAIQAAVDDAHANALARNGGPTVVYLDARDWDCDGTIELKSYVTIQGASRENTRLVKTGIGPVMACGNGNGSSIYSDTYVPTVVYGVTVQDVWLDCAQQEVGQSGPGWSSKGMVLVDVARGTFRRITITQPRLSGLGLDYPSDHTVIDDCVVVGRGASGSNGFGTMSGRLEDEDYIITNCTAMNVRAGFVIEVHHNLSDNGKTARIDNCLSMNCQFGFENAGVPAATFDSCIALRSYQAGFKFGEGDHNGFDLATGLATMNNCISADGYGDGVHAYFDTPAAARRDSLAIQNSLIDNNVGAGVRVTLADFDVKNLTVRGNTITRNDGGGISFEASSTGVMIDPSVIGNDIHGNTGAGIRLDTDTTRGRVESNSVTGGTKGFELVGGRTATGMVVNGGHLSSPTPVDAAGTLTDCSVGFVPGWTRAAGAPTAKAPLGTVYQRTDGTAGTLLYVNTDGGTTWSAYA